MVHTHVYARVYYMSQIYARVYYTCIHIYTYAYIHTYIDTWVYMRVYMCVYTRINSIHAYILYMRINYTRACNIYARPIPNGPIPAFTRAPGQRGLKHVDVVCPK